MSALPDYEIKESYTESEMQHIVARRMIAIDIQRLQDGHLALQMELRKEIGELKASVKELVDAWNSAGGMVKMVKYVASFLLAVGVVTTFLKAYLK